MIANLIKKVKGYDKQKRLKRLIEIGVKHTFDKAKPHEMMELELIQLIREENGEIEEVKKMRELTDKIDSQNGG